MLYYGFGTEGNSVFCREGYKVCTCEHKEDKKIALYCTVIQEVKKDEQNQKIDICERTTSKEEGEDVFHY
jgi:hypothetical protein